ncbi:type II toxin-antitoxin system RelE/ParE family toxin [Saccharibacillus sp. CPCC 101409]|uniref:type II toxin-antitoxin system RelE/ParE family toxin n=1 Tax=Saccharibacillus sp. CPCC 101409 TaxID=3058041 RepID=UPI002672E652|nr:type II toxin-antitoxin system RelE/ParE family toxin [Saccharibacillus sp. CPCC 101409]MDO3408397.1 type II toxin-antitoxin system RelE/ParE family toxin [Saccharibacillus sp. CPCC 101409]
MSNNSMLPVTYLRPAAKYFKKLVEAPLKKAYLEAIIAIRNNPELGEAKTGDLSGIRGYDIFYQGTNYEIAYRVEENEEGELIVVILAGSRENFYEQLKRYMK